MNLTAGIIAALSLIYIYGAKRQPSLEFFKAEEFGPYWALMNPELLKKMDAFRRELGYPVDISQARGAIGRPVIDEENTEDRDSGSWHNYLRHGSVMAVDLMPRYPYGAAPLSERKRWAEIAERVGFSGIGVYENWRPRAGLHVDIRTDRKGMGPLVWTGRPDGKGGQVYEYGGVFA